MSSSIAAGTKHKKPTTINLLTTIFCSNNGKHCNSSGGGSGSGGEDDGCCDDDQEVAETNRLLLDTSNVHTLIVDPHEALHSPYHSRIIDQDIENIRLSRYDNPYIKSILSSNPNLRATAMSTQDISGVIGEIGGGGGGGGANEFNNIMDLHSKLIRSPPPIMWKRASSGKPTSGSGAGIRYSEPEFKRLNYGDDDGDEREQSSYFQFPSTTLSTTNANAANLQNAADYHEIIGKFNLSPDVNRINNRKNS